MKASVCVFHQSLGLNYGGAASVCVWILEALKGDYNLFLATPDRHVDFGQINSMYGTNLSQGEITVVALEIPRLLRIISHRTLKSVRLASAARALRRLADSFDLIVNTTNEMSLPLRSFQYVHCPIRSRLTVAELYKPPERWLRLVNNLLFKAISGFSRREMGENSRFVVNSDWTANRFRKAYGIDAKIIYPPVAIGNIKHEANERETGIVAIGRLVREKRLHEAILIVDALRKDIPDMHLHIVGDGTGIYAKRILRMVDSRNYINLHRRISREELADIVSRHLYGIHTARCEHFGMAPAEMVAGGAVVFVHNSGGQVEVVGKLPELVFKDAQEAAQKILRMSRSKRLLAQTISRLSVLNRSFSTSIFAESIRVAVREMLEEGSRLPCPAIKKECSG